MATYTNSGGVLECTGTDITTAGIVAAVNANSGSLNTVGGSAASATTTLTEHGYRTSIINADFYIGNGSTSSNWVAENESITVWANIIGFDNANVRFGLKNANGTYSNPVFFSYDSTNNVGDQERWKLLNGGHFEAYGSTIICDNLLTYEISVGDVTFERCFLSIIDGLGDESNRYGTTNSPTVKYIDCIIDGHVGVGLKLYQNINYVLDRVSITNNTYGIQSRQDARVLIDLKLDTNTYHSVPNLGSNDVTLINSDITTLRVAFSDSSDIHRLVQRFDYQSVDSTGAALSGVIVRIVDQTSAVVVNNEATDVSGELSTLPTYDGIKCLQFKTYAGPTGTNKGQHSLFSYKYGFSLKFKTIAVQANTDIQETDFKLVNPDTTEANKVTVDAYSTLDDSFKLKDRADSFLEDNLGALVDFIIGRSGDQVVLTDKNLIMDSTAVSAFYYSDPTITIKSSTFTGGATATTGTVTTQNGTLLNGGKFDCDIVYDSGAGTTITNVVHTGSFDFTTAGTYTIDGGSLDEITNSSGGAVNLNLNNGASVTTNTGPNITLASPVDIIAPNILTGSRVQLYNVTKDAELDNSVASGSYSLTVNLADASIDDGDTVRLRATYQSGVTAKAELETSGVISASGLSFVNTQVDNDVYNAYGVDGSTITEFSFDSGNIEVDINDSDNTTEIQRLACWEAYFETTEQGIRDFFGCIDWESLNSVQIVTSMCDLTLDNTKASPLLMTGGRLYRSDGATVISSTSNSIQIDYEPVYIGNADDITDIKATIDTNLDVVLSTRASQTSVDNLPSSVPSVTDIVDGVFDEIV